MAAGSGLWIGLQGATILPETIPFLTNSSLTLSFSAIFLIKGVMPDLASSMMLIASRIVLHGNNANGHLTR